MSEDEKTPEQRKQAAIELANAYREMMAMFAWKHLKGVVIERIKSDARATIDQRDITELTLAEVAEERGIRKAFDKLDSELNWILNGHEPISRK